MAENIITIDLGGTNTRVGLFENGELKNTAVIDTAENPEEFISDVAEEIKKFELESITNIGVGAAGYWDKGCLLRQSIHLKKYVDQPIWDKISAEFKVPVYLKTDVELAAMGEALYGLENQYSNVLYINMGTGFAAGLYKDGQIFCTDYSPALRLDFMVHPQIVGAENDQKLESTAILSSTLINLALILSPQVIAIGGGKAQSNWDEVVGPAIEKAMEYLKEVLCYEIKVQKSKLEYPVLYGAYELAKKTLIHA